MRILTRSFVVVLVLLALTLPTLAQEARLSVASADVPAAYQLSGIQHIYQGWNNCGPATLTMGLTYFGVAADQYPAAAWLKPNGEDKNVSPWQMVEYVNTQVPGTVRALARHNGTLDLLKQLIANEFVVVIEEGYDPPEENLGWMGHYLLIAGYDDARQMFITMDSYKGPNREYSYAHVNEYWRHFNRLFIVLYDWTREEELLALLGPDADETQNVTRALETARAEAVANPEDPFAWFNMGTNFALQGRWNEAATAFDQASRVGGGLPWRMSWYQFGPFEAYYHTGRYTDLLALVTHNLNDGGGGGEFVEETYYYAGLARVAMGETDRGIDNLRYALQFNPNFTPAREALAGLGA